MELKDFEKKKEFKEFLKQFSHKNINYLTSAFEELLLQDIYMNDESAKIKLNRNVTKLLFDEIKLFYDQKRNIRYSCKGPTRSGKSYSMLKIMSIIFKLNGISFNEKVDYYVCGNQIEYRQKLLNAKFGDFYLVDENYFTRAGLGANIETSQLKDYNNIIAKQNIGNIFVTPEKFLNVGSVLGFATYGRDSSNWLSRMLVYHFKDGFPYLIGFVVIDIGELYRENGCYLYKTLGGCTNSKRIEFEEIAPELIKYSWVIPSEFKDLNYLKSKIPRLEDGEISACPFYNVCNHGMAKYERKKDSWIEKELKGGLDERTHERFTLACKLILDLNPTILPESNLIKVQAKNGKDLKNRVKLKFHKYTNTKFGISEFEELLEIIKSNTDISMLCDTLLLLELDDLKEKFFKLENGTIIKTQYEELKKEKILREKEEKEKTKS